MYACIYLYIVNSIDTGMYAYTCLSNLLHDLIEASHGLIEASHSLTEASHGLIEASHGLIEASHGLLTDSK